VFTGVDDLPTSAFADGGSRAFPVHTKAAAYLSLVSFERQNGQFAEHERLHIGRHLEKAARLWDIRDEIPTIQENVKQASLAAQVAPDEDFAMVTSDGQFFPIDNADSIMKSASSFAEVRKNIPFTLRNETAKKIYKAAVANAIDPRQLPVEVIRSAGRGTCIKQAAVTELNRRIANLPAKRRALGEPLKKVAAFVNEAPRLDEKLLTKVATVLDAFDFHTNMRTKYGSTFALPEDILFNCTETQTKEASFDVVTLPNGKVYRIAALEKVANYIALIDGAPVSDFDGSLNILRLRTMDKMAAAQVSTVLRNCGVRPIN